MKEFQELKNEMIRLNISHASVSQNKSNLKIPWNKIRNIIRLTFFNTDFRITICKGQMCVPELKDRLRECHTSSIGGHKGITKTVARIRT